ncbi:MAG TPA: hypothetical protein VHZ74_22950 [Bryobacteraceae bacterium]|nr:hypothetical protein [Bryobacteraceae bacterium]
MVFSDLELARRLERTESLAGARFVEARHRVSPEIGATWIDVAGTYAMFDGPTSPATQTFGLGLFAEATSADLGRIEKFFRERRAPVTHEVSPLAGVPVADLLSRREYLPIEFTSVMYKSLEPNPSAPDTDSRLSIRLALPGEEDLYSQTSVRGWGLPDFTEFLQALGRVVAVCEGSFNFFACLEGQPVATAVLHCAGNVAFLAGASTVPEARRLGAQRSLLDARLRVAVARGCDIAMMDAEPGSASQRNAEREGFRIAYTRTKWQLTTAGT